MTRIVIILFSSIIFFINQAALAASGPFFQVSESGIPAGTTNNKISLTLCLNGNGPLSCQYYTVSTLNLSIRTTIPHHTYPSVGIKINTPGYTATGCTPTSNGYCLFSANNTNPTNINLSAANIVPMLVNAGPAGVDAQNEAFVSITVCEPGTKNCQTIDNIQVDTGSTGIRLIADVLNPSLNLPALTVGGSPIAECYTYVSSSVWGSVRKADVIIGGETAHSIPIQIMGDPASPYATVPGSCPPPITNTVVSFGANGIIGVNNFNPDCGELCTNSSPPVTAFYYSCDSSNCLTSTNLALTDQVPNPATFFEKDNNGVILELPAISNAGEVSVTGSLIFGIGTQPNNQLGNVTIFPTTSSGNFRTIYNNISRVSYTDSGTNEYVFPNDTVPPIPVSGGYYDPAQPLQLEATMVGHGDAPIKMVDFTLVSQTRLAANITAAFIGSPGGGFVWGLPFFFGRNVFTAIDGAYTPGGYGPYIAY